MNKYPVTKPWFSGAELANISAALDSGWVAQGSRVAEFEKKVAAHEQVKEGIATTSCTTALHLAMFAQGLSAGFDAIVPAFTFVATANAVVMTGAAPVLCDISQQTYNIDTEKLTELIETQYKPHDGRLVNRQTGNLLWGIIPVHEFGLCCEINQVNELAAEYNLQVIEDGACALGARIGATHQGAFGNTSCISFHPRKSITTGEGGMILTDNSELASRLRALRTHGATVSAQERDRGGGFLLPSFTEAGFNYRMTDIQGAMGLAQMDKLDAIIGAKRQGAAVYNRLIGDSLPELITPLEPEGYYHTYQSYVCMLNLEVLGLKSIEEGGKLRNALLGRLEEQGIATRQGTHAVHLLDYYRQRSHFAQEDFHNAFACDHLSLTLPLYYGITAADQEHITAVIRKTLDGIRG